MHPGPGFVKCYMHNGCFKCIFITPGTWMGPLAPPEIADNINYEESGNLRANGCRRKRNHHVPKDAVGSPAENGFLRGRKGAKALPLGCASESPI